MKTKESIGIVLSLWSAGFSGMTLNSFNLNMCDRTFSLKFPVFTTKEERRRKKKKEEERREKEEEEGRRRRRRERQQRVG